MRAYKGEVLGQSLAEDLGLVDGVTVLPRV